ncbi:MAG: hypothetical protein ACYTGZ_21030 [Planctomycetota bacterium]|jgi:hypothetical protein
MSGRGALALALVAAGVGFWAGRATSDRTDRAELRGRAPARETPQARFAAETAAEERVALMKRLRSAQDETESLRTRLHKYEPPEGDAEAPPPGTRLPDGTIVGGAMWNSSFQRLAQGFLDSLLTSFIRDAKLSPEQERRVRSLILKRSSKFMQVNADFVNGEIDGEAAYERLEGLSTDLRAQVGEMLNEEQRSNFGNLQQGIRNIMRSQVVHNEMATLKSTLGLDAGQEKKVLAIVEERYKRVEAGISIPIPNVFFKPLRRERDATIYEETADAIRAVLSADQAARFNQLEAKAPSATFQYRPQLVPKK